MPFRWQVNQIGGMRERSYYELFRTVLTQPGVRSLVFQMKAVVCPAGA